MSEDNVGVHDHGPHQHAHVAPTTQQMRTVGQRRRDAEEKLEHHLQEALHKDHPHPGEASHPAAAQEGSKDAATIRDDDALNAADRSDPTAGQVGDEGEASTDL